MSDVQPIPEDSALFRLLTAAARLSEASQAVVEWAAAPKMFAQEIAHFAANPEGLHPLDDALDAIADAIVELHRAAGEHADTEPFAEAAARRLLGEDAP